MSATNHCALHVGIFVLHNLSAATVAITMPSYSRPSILMGGAVFGGHSNTNSITVVVHIAYMMEAYRVAIKSDIIFGSVPSSLNRNVTPISVIR